MRGRLRLSMSSGCCRWSGMPAVLGRGVTSRREADVWLGRFLWAGWFVLAYARVVWGALHCSGCGKGALPKMGRPIASGVQVAWSNGRGKRLAGRRGCLVRPNREAQGRICICL
jgi:hypothetical protein